MKLTKRGKDFLTTTLIGAVVATILDIKVVLAICLSLVFVAIISEFILARSSSQRVYIRPEFSHVTCFKGEETSLRLKVHSENRQLVSVTLLSLTPPKSVDAVIENVSPTTIGLRIRPKFAGRFLGLSAQFALTDALQLFTRTIERTSSDFVLDCYPSSILKEIKPAETVSLSLGDGEGTHRGLGLEFHSIDEYTRLAEIKSIFWKKVAANPDERLFVKTRVASIPTRVSVALIHTNERNEESPRWIDSACEAVALIGKSILQKGCNVEIVFNSNEKVISKFVSNLQELSESIMEMSNSGTSNLEYASLLLNECDICLTGFREIKNELFAAMVATKLVLLIEDEGVTIDKMGELVRVYRPYHDLNELVSKVVAL